jgi:uncharacterized Fe-S cluster-containing radical SAM superfamily protein
MLDANAQKIRRKFEDPWITENGKRRARVALKSPKILWFNTGTLCNIKCQNCYIKSSPTNNALGYITADEVGDYLDQLVTRKWPVGEIGLTGGEPFMNPEILEIIERCLDRNYMVLILTNAMQPMMRKNIKEGLIRLNKLFSNKIKLRISLDHFKALQHDTERGLGAFKKTLHGMDWLRDMKILFSVAGRKIWNETEAETRLGYGKLFKKKCYAIDANDPADIILFPEINENIETPEITNDCWNELEKDPDTVMCSYSRMVVKRNGMKKPVVLACTLITTSSEFELGYTLKEAEVDVSLNHATCSKFCVLGGASCSH